MVSDYRIKGETGDWEVVIGLEVHAQVVSNAKLFSGAATAFGAEPNTQVSLVDAAMPGMLPVPNRECIRQAVRTGMAIDAKINKWSRFDRKNYFYADLPQGYQISQLYHPLVGEGEITVLTDEKDEASAKTIGIERIHVEQDAGKLMHDQHPTMSYVDLNRSGVALMEIVSKPDMRSPAEAGAYLRKLRAILRYVGSCDGVTRPLRSKEDAHDYRYFPDPDLLPLELDDAFLEDCRASLPELPDAKRKRFEGLGISAYNASVLTAEVETAGWFDTLLSHDVDAKQAANWVVAELFGALNRLGVSIAESPVSPAHGAGLLKLVADGTISGSIAKTVFEKMLETGDPAGDIVEREGLKQTSDTGAIDAKIDEILAANADKVEQYKAGKEALFGFFVGQTMKAMQGKANPQVVNERLRAKLN